VRTEYGRVTGDQVKALKDITRLVYNTSPQDGIINCLVHSTIVSLSRISEAQRLGSSALGRGDGRGEWSTGRAPVIR